MKEKRLLQHWVKVAILLVICDAIVINAAYGLALWFRFDMHFSKIPFRYLSAWLYFAPFFTVITFGIFFGLKLYRSVWRYISINELERVIVACLLSFIVQVVGTSFFFVRMPISYYMMGGMLAFIAVAGTRFSYRLVRLLFRQFNTMNGSSQSRTMIIGAGEAGKILLRELRDSDVKNTRVCCIIDDNPNKRRRMLDNIPIVGTGDDIPAMVLKYKIDRIIIAIPSASAAEQRRLINISKETSCELKIIPGLTQILKGDVKVNHLRDVSVEDLLGRDPICVDLGEITNYIRGKTILVTGGGGSIGSELSRQIVAYDPKQLVLLDIYENSVYELQQELQSSYSSLNLEVLVGSVRDKLRIRKIMEKYRPNIIFHAAAHKHVPLLEDSPGEAIKNNILGTYEMSTAAVDFGVKRFILISTDKAVNPTSVMGASKRLCEMIIQSMSNKGITEFAAVRFGNVLGSNGSVVPLFKKQIEAGGPITVTHPEVTRYFMTIPEAVSLVIQAGAYAKSGEIFVLDMGSSTKIDELARNMIKLSGFEPDKDIEIKYIGLRPGEKLYEELLLAEEGLKRTKNSLIYIGQPLQIVPDFLNKIESLRMISERDPDQLRLIISQMVTEYQYAAEGSIV